MPWKILLVVIVVVRMAAALRNQRVEFEEHVFPDEIHVPPASELGCSYELPADSWPSFRSDDFD